MPLVKFLTGAGPIRPFLISILRWPPACFSDRVTLDPIAGQLEHYMDLLSARQKLVAANIANADTPGYRTRDIDFQREFLSSTGQPDVIEAPGLKTKNDDNNVNLDREARLLSENAL